MKTLKLMRVGVTHMLPVGLALSAVGCVHGDGDAAGRQPNGLTAVDQQESETVSDGEDGVLSLEDLDCPRGGSTAPIHVAFACDQITVVSCKDLSNVVLELADGSHQRFEGLHGQEGTFNGTGEHAGVPIVGVWVKAGANHSGDGPGYGQRFDAPEDSCDPGTPDEPPAEEPPPEEPPPEEPPAEEPPPEEPPPEEPPPEEPPAEEPPPEEPPPVVVL